MPMANPVVIVTSYGEHLSTADELIKNILQVTDNPNNEALDLSIDGVKFKKYICQINTKYYNINVDLVACPNELSNLPAGLLKQTEAVIAFFDANQPAFLQAPAMELVNLLQEQNIELGLLITKKLCDDKKQGITYEWAKTATQLLFDVIEIDGRDVDEDDSSSAFTDIMEALRNHLWSTVHYPENPLNKIQISSNETETEVDDELEGKLESFENLLLSIQNFKSLTANMDREQVLDHAEKLAERFSDLLVDD